MELKAQQQEILNSIAAFLKEEDSQVFILKGYAGTGKTTLVTSLIHSIMGMKKYPLLLAPTGRAAKVLRDKTGHDTRTIHSAIYSKAKIKTRRYDEDGNIIVLKNATDKTPDNKGIDKIEYFFGLKRLTDHSRPDGSNLTPDSTVILVDEASLISSRAAEGEVFHFGTDVLLDDLLTFAQLQDGAKIIFIGDPAQLPPVGDNQSNALNEDYFIQKGLSVLSGTLTEVLRQSGEGAILKNAMHIRDLLGKTMRNSLTLDHRENEFEKTTADDVVKNFYNAQPIPEIGDNIIICFSNTQVKEYNDRIRQLYFPGKSGVQEGDVLQIVKNDYNHEPFLDDRFKEVDNALYNGEFVTVLKVSPTPERISSFMWKNEGGQRKRVPMSLTFRDVEFLTFDGRHFATKIIETLLENDKSSLSPEQHMALYLLFRMRHQEIEKDQEAMEAALREDPYFNAIHVKYGYAITAHKSQGGEWKNAYVDYTGRTGLSANHLRWAYTATTRAVNHIFAVNAPNITPFSSFSISAIRSASKAPNGIVSLAEIDIVPELAYMQNFRRWKYTCTKTRLVEIDSEIERVEPKQYCDRYHIKTPTGMEMIDCWYSDADIFTRYLPQTPSTDITSEILKILQDESSFKYVITYSPSYQSLEDLWHKVTSACDEINIQIMNVQEFLDKYYVLYAFKTSGLFATIQFYFKGNGSITRAMPSSDLGMQDKLLVSLIEKISK